MERANIDNPKWLKRNIFMKILKIHKRGKIKNKMGTDQ